MKEEQEPGLTVLYRRGPPFINLVLIILLQMALPVFWLADCSQSLMIVAVKCFLDVSQLT